MNLMRICHKNRRRGSLVCATRPGLGKMGSMRRFASCCLAIGLVACARPQKPAADAQVENGGETAPAPVSSESAAQAKAEPGPHPLLDERAADPAHALPRLSYKNVGLHVGGGTGSADERQALLDALGQGEEKVLRCYARVEKPSAGGTFGSDLYVPASGGHPHVRAVRQKLGGLDFVECMQKALETVSFGPQARPLVISYSIRFELSS
jgi:hypothetical protein